MAGLETLNLTNNDLTTLDAGGFDGLTALETLNLNNNDLTTLADGGFDGLAALETLNLTNNDLTTLADGGFDGLAALETLNLRRNQLQSLPDGVFEPLTALTGLDLRNNRSAPFAPTADAQPDDGTVSSAGGRVPLDGSGSDGGPWGMNVTYGWALTDPTSGVTVRFDDDASVTPEARIPALAADTELTFTLTVTGRGGEDERGVAPATDTAKVTVVTVLPDPTAGVCGRTPAVRDALIAELGVTSCGAVSDAKLASITDLSLSGQEFTALAAGDFAGLTSLATLRLTNTALTALPGGVFDGLNALTNLVVNGTNTLTALSPGAFAGLTALTYLWLDNNGLENLPDGVFSGLTALTYLRLDFNGLTALSPGDFAGLSSLKTLRLENNELATLPDDVFEPLTALTDLRLLDNDGAPFSPEAVALPDDGTVPVAGGMVPLDGSGSGGAWGTNVTYGWALTDPASEVTVTFDNDASPTPEVTIPALMAGTALTFTLTVTGRGGTSGIDPATDIAKVTSTASDDATLSGLTVNHGTGDLTLDPTFAPGTFAYAAEVDKAVTTVTLTAMKTDDGASVSGVTLNGNAIADSDFTNGITVPSLLVGDNDIVVTVTAENGASQTYTVTVTRTNSAPTASDGSVTTDEDKAHTFAAVEFNFADSDGGDALASVTVVTLPAAGALELNGTAVMADQSVLVAGIGDLVFTPEANANGMGYASFTFKVSDGTEESALAYIMTVNVTAVNDPATGMPTISGTARVGETLTAVTTGIADADGPASPTYGYQWIRVDADGTSNATDVVGETADTYIPAEADDGKKLRVKVSFTDDDSSEEELTSDAFPSSGTIEVSADICGRTGVVRRALLALISSVSNCADVTATHLAAIGTLDLSNPTNPITALAAGDFAGLTSLTALRLYDNRLTTLPAGVFDGLTALRVLQLYNNRLTTLPDGVFGGLTALRTLRLEDNFLATLPAGVFDGLTALRTLGLYRNRLTTLPAGAFDGLTQLETLGLYENLLTTLPDGVFAGLTALRTLYLYDNRLTTLRAGVFAGLTQLETLNLSDNSLTRLPAGVFAELTALETLNLSDNSLTRLPAGVFAELTALTGLSLTGNDGAPFAPEAVALPDDGTVSNAGGTVPLDGSGSGGAWGTNVTYGWALTTPASGATFNDNTSPTPEVTIEALAPYTELTFTLTVTGRGGTDGITPDTDTATVTATGPPASDDATLSELTVNDGTSDLTLAPAFASGKFAYAADVAHAVDEVTLSATVNHAGASVSAVTLNGTAVADGDFTDGITVSGLLVGGNEIVVTVTAEDTSTTRTYTLTVTRAGVTVSTTALTVTEQDTTGGSYTVVLDSEPTATVTVTVAGHSGTDVTPDPTTLTFTTSNWDTAQTVTVTAGDDADTTDDSVTLTHSAASADSDYSSITIGGVVVTVRDNDTAQVTGVTVDAGDAQLVVNWAAVDNATGYTVQWKSGSESYNTGDRQATVTPGTTTSHTITGLTNGTEYTVRVSATRTDANDGPPSAEVQGTPAVPGVTVSTTALTVTEQDTTGGSYTVVLDSEPTATVTVTVAGHSGTDVTPDPTTLTFTTSNWDTAQTVTVTAGDDADTTDDSVTLTHSAASADSDYSGIAIDEVAVTVSDNDTARVTGLTVASGDARLVVNWTAVDNATGYKVQWKSGSESYNTGDRQATVTPGTTTSHTITGLTNGTEYTVRVSATRTDANDGPPSAEVQGTPAVPGVTVSTTALTVTEQDTTGGSYTVVLDSEPTATVTVTVAGHSGTDVTPDPTTLTFTTSNWDTAQTVTVTAGDDADTTDDSVTLTHSAASADSDYSGIAIDEVAVTVSDNDTARVTGLTVASGDARLVVNWTAVDNATGYKVQWKSGSESYNTGDRQATVTPGTTTSHTITGLTNGTEYTVRVSATRTDANDGPPSAEVQGTPAVPGVTVSTTALTVTEQDTTGGSYTVVLDSEPTATVTVTVAGHSGTDVTPDPTTLTFTTSNWDTAQTVTVTAGDDADTTDDSVTLTHSAASADSDYSSITIGGVVVTVRDNDTAQVTGVTVDAGDAQLVVNWAAVDNATGYTVQWKSGSESYNTGDRQATVTPGTTTSHTITGLTNGTEYTVRVSATRTDANDGPPSAEVQGTPAVPGVTVSTTALTVTEQDTTGGSYTVVLDSEPTATVTVTVAGHSGTDVTPDPTTLTFTTSNWDTAQTVTVTAGDDADTADDTVALTHSAASTDSNYSGITIPSVAVTVSDNDTARVTGVSVTSGNAQLVVNWTAVDNATGYKVQWKSGGQDYNTTNRQATVTPGSTTSHTITGLTNGTEYTVRVSATRTDANDGPPSAEVQGTPAVPGVTVSTTALTVTEQDTTGGSYTVVLDSEPTATVTVTVAGHSGTDVTPDPTTLTFTTSNWDTAQTVTVTAGDDADTTDDSVTLTHSAASADNDYSGIAIDEVAVTVSDNDTARVTGLTVASGDARLAVNWTAVDNATGYKVQWKSVGQDYNTGDRQFTIPSGTTTSHTITSLANGTEYTVRVSATRTGANDGPPSAEAKGTPAVPIAPGVTVSTTALTVTEQNPTGDGYTVVLDTEPTADVAVTVAGHAGTDVTPDPTTLTFTASNWETAQTVTVTAGDDADTEDDTVALTHSATSADNDYSGIAIDEVAVTVSDNDTAQVTGLTVASGNAQLVVNWTAVDNATGYKVQWKPVGQDYNTTNRQFTVTSGSTTSHTITGLANGTEYTVRVSATRTGANDGPPSAEAKGTPAAPGVTVSKTALTVTEQDTTGDSYTVVLDTEPTADVAVTVAGHAGTDVTANPATLTFTSTTWSTAQTVTVTAGDDADTTDDTVALTHSAASADSGYGGIAIDEVAVTVSDNDTARVTGLTVTPGDARLVMNWTAVDNATGYKVQWKSDGQDYNTTNRQFAVTSGSTTSHTITGLANGTEYTVRVSATRTGANDGPPSAEAKGTPAAPGVTVSKTALTVTEQDTTGDSYTVVLDTEPTADVAVTVAGHAGTDVTANPATLTFTSTTWSTAQTVTVTAGDDADTTDDSVALTHSAASTDNDYGGIAIDEVAVTVRDNDTARVTGLTVASGNAQLAVNWTAVDNATGYKVQWKSGGQDYNTTNRQATVTPGTDTSVTITGLANGTEYTVRVSATRTGANDGPPSAEVQGTPAVPIAPGVTVSTTTLTVTEEDTTGDGYTVVLDTEPTADVTVTVAGHAGTDVTPGPTTLTFTASNWDTAQTVTVTAGDDADTEDDTVALTHSAASADSDYSSITIGERGGDGA